MPSWRQIVRLHFLLLSGAPNLFHPHITLIMDCRDLLGMNPQTQVKHALRETNIAADAIAKKGFTPPMAFIFLYEGFSNVDFLCIVDHEGIGYLRQ
ncbi:hypothetical protein SLA2020_349940 [Shorea laevis]